MLPPPSDATTAVLEAVALARRFAFVVAVGLRENLELLHWTLYERFTSAGHRVRTVSAEQLADEVAIWSASEEAACPVLLVAEARTTDAGVRADTLVRMNLRRDAWGHVPVRIVYVCGDSGLEELHQSAPDLMHWRVLLQPFGPEDLPVASLTTYLAWCVDAYEVHDGDLVRRGGLRALEDPYVVELPETRGLPARGLRSFSRWVIDHFRGVVARNVDHAPGYPAKGLVRQWARHLLRGSADVPTPLLIAPDEVPGFVTDRRIPGTSFKVDELWRQRPRRPSIAFLIDDDAPVRPELALDLTRMGLRTIVVTTRDTENWSPLGWDSALVMEVLDPLVESPSRAVVESLSRLLAKLFPARSLQAWLETASASTSREELASLLAEQLLRRGEIKSSFFDGLLQSRPRDAEEIERVREAFAGIMYRHNP